MTSFEEYRFFTENTYRLSERRQTSTQTFLTINTAIFTILAFLAKDAGFTGWGLVLVGVPLFLTGLVVCVIWLRMLRDFTTLISWRYEQLRLMEQTVPESYQMMTKEWDTFFKPKQLPARFGFSRLEVQLPQLFMILYVVYGVGIVVAAALGWK